MYWKKENTRVQTNNTVDSSDAKQQQQASLKNGERARSDHMYIKKYIKINFRLK